MVRSFPATNLRHAASLPVNSIPNFCPTKLRPTKDVGWEIGLLASFMLAVAHFGISSLPGRWRLGGRKVEVCSGRGRGKVVTVGWVGRSGSRRAGEGEAREVEASTGAGEARGGEAEEASRVEMGTMRSFREEAWGGRS